MSTWRIPEVPAAILFVLVVHVAAFADSDRRPLTLPDALELALTHSPELEALDWGVRADEARMVQAGEMPNPELDLRLYRLGIPRRSTPDDTERMRVIVSQVFELGGKRRKRVALAGAEHRLAGLDYQARQAFVAAEVARRFAAVLGAQRRVETWADTTEFLERTHKRVMGLVEAGTLGRLASHRTARQIAIGRMELQRAESVLAAARFALVATWGGRSPSFTEAVGDFERIDALPGIETVIEMAQESPGARRWNAEAERSKARLALAKSERVPDITYGVGMRWESSFDQRDYLVDLEFDLPIFDRKRGEILAARRRMAQAEARHRAADAINSARISEAYFAVVEGRSRSMAFATEIVPASRAAFDAFLGVFDSQAENLEELLDSRQDLTRAESDHASALEDYHRALATLEALVGRSLSGVEDSRAEGSGR
ncbi:MAG: TolC family protein [Acidobacteria bacterium]|nr:TolC family protein [Acidobacteriota bacterium]NIQ30665.1 TolC family protein [Acidobacteriota bacterium]NIQ85623.1 TolC family protein [Acidobacteriota bacterium]